MTNIAHIGFILDGNRRWAQQNGLSIGEGYKAGIKSLLRVADRCNELGIDSITVFAFSTENWKRPKDQIDSIFSECKFFVGAFKGEYNISFVGDTKNLESRFLKLIAESKTASKKANRLNINIAFNYGARHDIVSATKSIANSLYDDARCLSRHDFEKKVDKLVREDNFQDYLSTSGLPELDIIVRTGGDTRLSNFLLFESAYSELMFLDKFWPEMTETDVDDILEEFEKRKRSFGA